VASWVYGGAGRILLALLSFVSIFLLLEGFVRLYPQAFGWGAGNEIISGYNTRSSGILVYRPDLAMYLMKPNFSTQMRSYNLTWAHETDSNGFRNPVDVSRAEYVLLGDSMIYGHGVGENETVAHFLREKTGMGVVNLAISGGCPHQDRYLIWARGLGYRPRYVVYYFMLNDAEDLDNYLSRAEISYYVENQSLEDHRTVLLEDKTRPRLNGLLNEYVLGYSHLARAAYWVFSDKMRESRGDINQLTGEEGGLTTDVRWRYVEKAVGEMNLLSRQNNATFAVVAIRTASKEQAEGLRRVCAQEGIPYIDAWENLSEQKNWLPLDGHFSPEGHMLLAELTLALTNNSQP
jgi:hypothetical protein